MWGPSAPEVPWEMTSHGEDPAETFPRQLSQLPGSTGWTAEQAQGACRVRTVTGQGLGQPTFLSFEDSEVNVQGPEGLFGDLMMEALEGVGAPEQEDRGERLVPEAALWGLFSDVRPWRRQERSQGWGVGAAGRPPRGRLTCGV